MSQPVLRSISQCLIHTPDMLYSYGSVPVMERLSNPGSDYAKRLPSHLRLYESALDYPPYQAYIGSLSPRELAEGRPLESLTGGERWGPYGEIMPEPEFLALMKLLDETGAVRLEGSFANAAGYWIAGHPLFVGGQIGAGVPLYELEERVTSGRALPLYFGARLAAAVEGDQAVLERLVVKTGLEVAYRHLISRAGLEPGARLHRIDCREEEFQATLVEAAELVAAGVYRNVGVVACGTPKALGRHSREQVSDDSSVLEDALRAYAVLVAEDDFASPRIVPGGAPGLAPATEWPLLWVLREQIMAGQIERWPLSGEGGRRAALEQNPGHQTAGVRKIRVGVTVLGGELGVAEVVRGAELAQRERPDLEVVLLGEPGMPTELEVAACACIGPAHREMERRLLAGDLHAAVTTRYSFGPDWAMVTRSPVLGREEPALLVSVPCRAAADRVEALVRGAIYGAAVARTLGRPAPSVDLLSLEDGREAERVLGELRNAGWSGQVGAAAQAADVLVTDRRGPREYVGVGVGEPFRSLVCAVQPTAESAAIAEAIGYAADLARGGVGERVAAELAAARSAGLEQLLRGHVVA